MDVRLDEQEGVRLAVEGCGHGTLHAIYASVAEACQRKQWPGVDLLIIGGDFQSVRNAYDLNCVSMPAKYRAMCDFHEYYSGQRKAPYLTLFVGGNHEASNFLFELYYGGWVAPNIYYMGAANILRLGPLRIAGLSGIWKGYNYRKPHHERLPYNESDLKSIYHVRELDVRKLLQVRSQVDIGISHDWPKGVEWKGNHRQLFRFKPHLEEDAKSGQLGNVAAQQVLDWLRPRFWFSAHLHCKYAAVLKHSEQDSRQDPEQHPRKAEVTVQNGDEIDLDSAADSILSKPGESNDTGTMTITNEDEIDLDDEDGDSTPAQTHSEATKNSAHDTADSSASNPWPYTQSLQAATAALPASFHRKPPERPIRPAAIDNKVTHFLALDKCLPGKHFLQLSSIAAEVEVEQRPLKLEYDPEWLGIVRSFAIDEPLVLGDPDASVPRTKQFSEYQVRINEQIQWINDHITPQDLVIPESFQLTGPVYDGGMHSSPEYAQVEEHPNPQTEAFCQMLQIPNPFAISDEDRKARMAAGPPPDRFDGGNKRENGGRGGHGRGRGRGHGRGRGGDRGGGFRGRGHSRGGHSFSG